MKLKTTDINLTAFLIISGYKVISTNPKGRLIEFSFDGAEKEGESWQFAPTDDMELIQKFVAQKDKLLSFLKSKTKETRGGYHGTLQKE